MAAAYDRLAELKAFDETKAGVKGLADAGITELPRFFHAPPHLLHGSPAAPADDPSFVFPIIDLDGAWEDPDKRNRIVGEIREAFFELDVEQKKEYFGRDMTKKVVYNTNFDLYSSPAANWRDTILFHMAPNPPEPEQLPTCCREIVTEFSKEMLNLGDLLFQLLSEALGLRSNHLKEIGCLEGMDTAYNYYPVCPEPELTLGATQHTDTGFITVLAQDDIGGLQVLHRNCWVDVPPMSQGAEPRVSAISFFGIGYTLNARLYGPVEELLSEDNPPKYKKTTIKDLVAHAYKQGLDGTSFLQHLKLMD
ncbi:unnamed protein product [Linum tenue]|uniref:Isopenicillin N synthase-like Fe(2+) 2OG dioxygenase domain-containing protein n=1 Tax=Linum tenue TaxID=586396 RepID=A0AAV0L6S3_9ROSI|nr:unnamed protein product [Linum tenue]